jgi:hypothetical protein
LSIAAQLPSQLVQLSARTRSVGVLFRLSDDLQLRSWPPLKLFKNLLSEPLQSILCLVSSQPIQTIAFKHTLGE